MPSAEADDGHEREPGRLEELTDGVAELGMHGDLRHILPQWLMIGQAGGRFPITGAALNALL